MNDFATDSIRDAVWVCKADVPECVTTRVANNRNSILQSKICDPYLDLRKMTFQCVADFKTANLITTTDVSGSSITHFTFMSHSHSFLKQQNLEKVAESHSHASAQSDF